VGNLLFVMFRYLLRRPLDRGTRVTYERFKLDRFKFAITSGRLQVVREVFLVPGHRSK